MVKKTKKLRKIKKMKGGDKPVSICSVCNKKYLKYLNNSLKSFILNCSEENMVYNHFYIYLKDDEIKEVNDKYKCFIEKSNIKINFVKNPEKVDTRLFSCHYRFEAVKELIDRDIYSKVLYYDINSIINRPIYDICRDNRYSFNVFLRYNLYNEDHINGSNIDLNENSRLHKIIINIYGGFVMSGVFMCNNDKNGKEIINRIIGKYKKSKIKYWFLDQHILSEIFIEFISKKIEIGILSKDFFDLKCRDESRLWLSKGNMVTSYERKCMRKNMIKIEKKVKEC